MMRLIWILFLATTTFAHAFIGGQTPEQAPLPEPSEADMARKQSAAAGATVGELNPVEMDTERYDRASLPLDAAARDEIVAATNSLAERNVVEAASRIEDRSGTPGYVWGLLFAVVGVGCALGLRHWANKSLPAPPTITKTKW